MKLYGMMDDKELLAMMKCIYIIHPATDDTDNDTDNDNDTNESKCFRCVYCQLVYDIVDSIIYLLSTAHDTYVDMYNSDHAGTNSQCEFPKNSMNDQPPLNYDYAGRIECPNVLLERAIFLLLVDNGKYHDRSKLDELLQIYCDFSCGIFNAFRPNLDIQHRLQIGFYVHRNMHYQGHH